MNVRQAISQLEPDMFDFALRVALRAFTVLVAKQHLSQIKGAVSGGTPLHQRVILGGPVCALPHVLQNEPVASSLTL